MDGRATERQGNGATAIMDERLGHVVEKIPALLFADRLNSPNSFQPAMAQVALSS